MNYLIGWKLNIFENIVPCEVEAKYIHKFIKIELNLILKGCISICLLFELFGFISGINNKLLQIYILSSENFNFKRKRGKEQIFLSIYKIQFRYELIFVFVAGGTRRFMSS